MSSHCLWIIGSKGSSPFQTNRRNGLPSVQVSAGTVSFQLSAWLEIQVVLIPCAAIPAFQWVHDRRYMPKTPVPTGNLTRSAQRAYSRGGAGGHGCKALDRKAPRCVSANSEADEPRDAPLPSMIECGGIGSCAIPETCRMLRGTLWAADWLGRRCGSWLIRGPRCSSLFRFGTSPHAACMSARSSGRALTGP